METLNAIIIDDEINARENLHHLITEFCKNITIVSEAKNVDEAVIEIHKHQPDLIFLDIEMPQKNGFQLLDAFDKIDFQIIFVTAYDQYAIKAFECAALDYLLKPIDINRLKKSIKKASTFSKTKSNIDKFKLLKSNRKKATKIAIPYKSDYVVLDLSEILCIEADRMYSIIHTVDNKKYIASKKLSYYEDLLAINESFIRVHRSWMINTHSIEIYSKKDKTIQLENQFKVPVSKSYKENFENIFCI